MLMHGTAHVAATWEAPRQVPLLFSKSPDLLFVCIPRPNSCSAASSQPLKDLELMAGCLIMPAGLSFFDLGVYLVTVLMCFSVGA